MDVRKLAAFLSVIFVAAPAFAQRGGDAAAFENSVAALASAVHRPNPIAYLVSVGEYYCRLKAARGGGALDIPVATRTLQESDPGAAPRTADEVMAVDAAMSEANKLLCP